MLNLPEPFDSNALFQAAVEHSLAVAQDAQSRNAADAVDIAQAVEDDALRDFLLARTRWQAAKRRTEAAVRSYAQRMVRA